MVQSSTPPLPRDGHGQEDHVYGGVVPQGYVTPAPPCGCGRGVAVVVCLYSMCNPPVVVMVLRMMCMQGLAHKKRLPPREGGCSRIVYLYVYVWICMYVYMYMYVCKYVCKCICMYMHIYIYVCICMNTHVCVYVYVCMYVSMYVNVFVCFCMYMHVYVWIRMYMYVCIYIYISVYRYIRLFIYVYVWNMSISATRIYRGMYRIYREYVQYIYIYVYICVVYIQCIHGYKFKWCLCRVYIECI